MTHTKTLATLFTAIFAATVFCGNFSFADFDARNIQENFDAMNSGDDFIFTFKADSQGGDILTSANGKDDVDVTAYNMQSGRSGFDSSQQSYFRTFCVEPGATVREGEVLIGTLSYELKGSEMVTQTTEGNELTLGAAILYKEFAVGNRSAVGLRDAILVLMGINSSNNWGTNEHLAYLWGIASDSDVWTVNYDPAQYHAMIGDYCVFIMDVVSATDRRDRQDFLYIAKVNTSTDVPEPASILLWTLGGLGAVGTSWARKRRMKKSVAA